MGMEVFGYAIVLALISWRNGRDMKAAVAAIRVDVQASREQMARQHEDAMALLREMHEGVERMHAETQRVLLRIAELIAAEGERTRAALSGGRSRPGE